MALFEDQGPNPGQRHNEMEAMEFRIACGEFIGISDIDKEELEGREWLRSQKAFLTRKACSPRAPGQVDGAKDRGQSVVYLSSQCGRLATGSHCFGGGSEQNWRRPLQLESIIARRSIRRMELGCI